ncbi:hypothetical protein OSB04_019332 [Centaurea solstitialis]|uniref:Malic enzyme n=1 Tax=Centaurea solstitialis TaxID=347529 RepID=A0AA38SRS8_9ASTR|nr:hypothetical protein OSB04_019332 [Centaurea solstitialis]
MKNMAKIPYLKYSGAKVPIQSDTCGTLAVTLARVLMAAFMGAFLMLTSSSSFKRINSLRNLLGGLGGRGDKKNLSVMGAAEDEDNSTVDEPFTPWIVSVASGHMLLRDPHYNKGLAFTEKERDAHYLRGLLPPAVFTQELQEKRTMHILRQYQVPLHRYIAMMDLQERNERLFYKLLVEYVEELLPIVYTPTVGEACQKYGSIYRRPQGLYISLKDKGRISEVMKNWPEKNIQVIVVTDGERILGLGDLGCQGMGIPVGKLSLYTALGGVRPSVCLPVTIDVGTKNETLLKDEFYIGLKQKRATGEEYDNLLEEFMDAVKTNYGEKVLIQFEDFANHNAFDLLIKYRTSHLVFNDDIQGTACVVLGGLLSALKLIGGTLSDHTFLFLGAGEAGTGIAELISLEILKKTKMTVEESRKKIWLVDSKEKEPEKEKETEKEKVSEAEKETEKEKVSEAEKEKEERIEEKEKEEKNEDATMEEGDSQPSEQQKASDAKRKKSIAHKKSAKKLKLVHDSAGSEINDWDSQEQDKKIVWMVESKGGKLDTYRSVYSMFLG